MQAMLFKGRSVLDFETIEVPAPEAGQVLIKVEACAVCRTDLHVIDGDLKKPKTPWVVPGHEIVGRIVALGADVSEHKIGERVGVPWLASTCGTCAFCRRQEENLCDEPQFTGYTKDGGFAQYTVADKRFAFTLPEKIDPIEFSPMLCAGLIGWRCLRFARPALDKGEGRLGIYGFGAAGHIVAQVAIQMGYKIYAFVRKGDQQAIDFALSLGATYAGASDEVSPQTLDAAIIFATTGELVPAALKSLRKGGELVLGGIHMSDIPALPYDLLWGERTIQSVANLTRLDGEEFIAYLAKNKVTTSTTIRPLAEANQAIALLRGGKISGAVVLRP
ncbi:MAG: zinc-dependent alcohol dehydrogenase family protein [Cyanobacteria bacterium REEB67]|nr:zinc-dependent alcohol dehydrogenase family protein [Cyanobacteria bacterium REEB67]